MVMSHRVRSFLIFLLLMGVTLFNGGTFGAVPAAVKTVTGETGIGSDPDRMYREALFDSFLKAYAAAYQTDKAGFSVDVNEDSDIKEIQIALGISNYQVLRYWRENDKFYLETTVYFGESATDTFLGSSHGFDLKWSYQTEDQVESVVWTGSSVAIVTTQTIEVVDTENGKKKKRIKTGLKAHAVSENYYFVQENHYLKLSTLTKINLFNLAFLWRKKIPESSRYYLNSDGMFIIGRSGLVQVFDLEEGNEKWKISANSQAELVLISPGRLLVVLPGGEIWLVDQDGKQIWGKKFEAQFLGKPLVSGGEIFCLLDNGEMKTVEITTGRTIGSWSTMVTPYAQNVCLSADGKEVFLLYNDPKQGCLQAFHRYTGNMIWEVEWPAPVTGMMLATEKGLIIGTGNSLERRESWFGMKVAEVMTFGQITRIYQFREKIMVSAGNRVYCYEIR